MPWGRRRILTLVVRGQRLDGSHVGVDERTKAFELRRPKPFDLRVAGRLGGG